MRLLVASLGGMQSSGTSRQLYVNSAKKGKKAIGNMKKPISLRRMDASGCC